MFTVLCSFIKNKHKPELRGVNVDFCLPLAGLNRQNNSPEFKVGILEHAAVVLNFQSETLSVLDKTALFSNFWLPTDNTSWKI